VPNLFACLRMQTPLWSASAPSAARFCRAHAARLGKTCRLRFVWSAVPRCGIAFEPASLLALPLACIALHTTRDPLCNPRYNVETVDLFLGLSHIDLFFQRDR
jgi:hypothetical protein